MDDSAAVVVVDFEVDADFADTADCGVVADLVGTADCDVVDVRMAMQVKDGSWGSSEASDPLPGGDGGVSHG